MKHYIVGYREAGVILSAIPVLMATPYAKEAASWLKRAGLRVMVAEAQTNPCGLNIRELRYQSVEEALP